MNDMTSPPILSPALVHEWALRAQQENRSVVDICTDVLKITAREASALMADYLGYPFVDAVELFDWQPDFQILPLARALQRDCILYMIGTRGLDRYTAVIHDPLDHTIQAWLDVLTERQIDYVIACRADIHAVLSRQEENARAFDVMEPAGARIDTDSDVETLSLSTIAEDSSPIVKLVNSTLYDAFKEGASDIHIETTPSGLCVKYRVDGVLNLVTQIHGVEIAEQTLSRIKVLAQLDIAEQRIPQDGRFRISTKGRQVDMRVSIMPSIHGEDAVIRILDKRQIIPDGRSLTLDLLGFDAPSLLAVRKLAAAPYGMLLVTGPTGSGKTTTLYAAISEVNHGRDKIITIEDPVEYELAGVLQIPVNEKKGLTFAKGLRSILRHDPDKIMVGEIRDAETAEIAVQSALTGHLVLSTVHANNVFDVFSRFTHMGIDPYALTSALNGIWAQRLIRSNCQHCAQPYHPSASELALLGLSEADIASFRLMKGKGCGDCRGTGYRGRKAIAEVLTLNDPIRVLITNRAPIDQIKEAARLSGTRYLREVAMDMAKAGETTLEEVNRITL